MNSENWEEVEGHHLLQVKSLTSTNDFLEVLLNSTSCDNGTIVLAKEQTKGQGMRGSLWESEAGKNLTFSYLFVPGKLRVEDQFYVSKAACLAVSNAVNTMMGNEQSKVKWPNDIYMNNKKMAGILIKSSLKGEWIQHLSIGIGLNVNQESFKLETATSMKMESGQSFDLQSVLREVIREVDKHLSWVEGKELDLIDRYYYRKLIGFGKWLLYRIGDKKVEGSIVRIQTNGHVILQFRNGKTKNFDLKEISLVPAGQDGQPAY